jgi:hypothetical protein
MQLDGDSRQLQLGLDRVHDLVTDVERVADGLVFVVVVGERDRGVAVAQRDGARILDLVERALGAACCSRGSREPRATASPATVARGRAGAFERLRDAIELVLSDAVFDRPTPSTPGSPVADARARDRMIDVRP